MMRHLLLKSAGMATVIAVAPLAIVQSAVAQDARATAIYEEGLSINGAIATLRIDVQTTLNGLPASYACPPGTPARAGDVTAAQALKGRVTQISRRISVLQREYNDAINDRSVLGETSAGALESLDFGTANLAAMRSAQQAVGRDIGALERTIASRPKTEAECDGTDDPVASISFAPASVEPGTRVNAAISARTASGKAVNISSVTVTGMDAFATLENTRTPGGAANITFKTDDVRRQGPFSVGITVQGAPAGAPASATGTRYTQRFSYTVANAAPRIISMPEAPSAEPGEDVSLSGDIVIIDTNADDRNGSEIVQQNVKLDGHPAGLVTTPDGAFGRNLAVTNRRHDPTTGQYTFKIERSASAKYPHAHGTFGTSVSVADRDGKSTSQAFDITILNTPPEPRFTSPRAPGNAYHSGDGEMVAISGTVKDANGRDDIASIEIDATDAGGGAYRMFDGVKTLDVTPAGDDTVRFEIVPDEFPHTDDSGRHEIRASAGDDGAPEQNVAATTTPFSTFITVGNTAPEVGAIGFLSGTQVVPTKRICPGDLFTAAAQVKDAEGDTLKVTATLLPGGQPQELKKSDGSNTYVADIRAPDAPGEYTIRFDAVETGTNDPKQNLRSMELTVEVCGDPEEAPKAAIGEDVDADPETQVALGNTEPEETPVRGVAVSGGFGEFEADGMGAISAGTLVPSSGGDEGPLVTAELEDWDGWHVNGAITGPQFRGKPTRFWAEYGHYSSDTDRIGSDPENGEFGVALTYADEFAFLDDGGEGGEGGTGGETQTSTGLFLGDAFGLDGSARGEGDLYYLKFGVDKLKWSNDGFDLNTGVFGFHRKVETNFWSCASASFAGSPFGGIGQTNQIETEVEQFGVGLSGIGTFDLLPRDGVQPGIGFNVSGLLELMNSDATGRFNQTTTCDPGVCGAALSNVVFNEDFSDSSFDIGGSLRFGFDVDITEYFSLGAGYRFGVLPGIPTYDLPTSPNNQPGSWSTDSADYQGYDFSARLRAAF